MGESLAAGRATVYPACPMRGIFSTLGTFLVGSVGWAIGQRVGLGTALILGSIGSGVGMYYGRKLFNEWLG